MKRYAIIYIVKHYMETKKHPHLPVFILLSLVFIGFVLLTSYFSYRQKADDSVVKVGLKWLHSAQFAGMYVAKEQKMYEDGGLTVEFNEPTEDKRSTIDSLLSGENDYVIVSALELLDHVAQNDPVKAVAVIYQETPTVIASLPESGINKPEDLRNKVLGTTRNENYSFSLYKFLGNKYKVPVNSMTFKNIGFNAVDDLINGEVDAVSMYRTRLYLPKDYPEIKFNLIKPEDYDIHMYSDVIVTTNELIEKKPEQVQAFVNATIKGWEYALDYRDEAVDITMPYTSGRQRDEEFERQILTVSAPLIRTDKIEHVGEMSTGRWLEMYYLYKTSVLVSEFDIAKAYTTEFLP